MKKMIIVLPLVGLVSACGISRDKQLAIYRSKCTDYGYIAGTPEFSQCMMKQEERAEELTRHQRKVSAIEEQNWLEREQMRAAARDKEEERKRKKKRKKAKKHPF